MAEQDQEQAQGQEVEDEVEVVIHTGEFKWDELKESTSLTFNDNNDNGNDNDNDDEDDLFQASLPGNYTEKQIKDFIIENYPYNTGNVYSIEEFDIPVIKLEIKSHKPGEENRLSRMTLKECYAAEAADRGSHLEALHLYFYVYDDYLIKEGEKRKAARAAIDRVLHSSTCPTTIDELADALALKYIACPFDRAYFEDNDFVARNERIWKNKIDSIERNLLQWVYANPENLQFLQNSFANIEFLKRLNNIKGQYHESALLCTLRCAKPTEYDFESAKNTFQYKLHTEFLSPDQWIQSYAQIVKLPHQFYHHKDQIRKLIDTVEDKSLLDALPRQFMDSLMYDRQLKTPMPNILPTTEEIAKLTADELEAIIQKYVGMEFEHFTKTLIPSNFCDSGFIQVGERLGEVIKKDAELLLKLGIDRFKLAERMEAGILVARRELCERHGKPEEVQSYKAIAERVLGTYSDEELPWTIGRISFRGSQEDPFHPSFDNPSCSATSDYFVNFKKEQPTQANQADFSYGSLLPQLIRRLCFFETTAYRVDPAKAYATFFHPKIEDLIAKHTKQHEN